MQFNSYEYMLLLPLSVILYFLANKINFKIGKFIIIASSLIFYLYRNDESYIFIFSIIINYFLSLLLVKINDRVSKKLCILPIILNIATLLYFKYSNFAIDNLSIVLDNKIAIEKIIAPLAISFFTFQQVSYNVFVCRNKCEVSLLDYLSFILFFPKLVMGPLMEPKDFINQINDDSKKHINIDNIVCGLKLLSLGLSKKVLLADTFHKAVSWGFDNIEIASSFDWMLISIFYLFEIYFDFSGYSDMAAGSSIMFNITLPINFNSPYKALNIRDFWKRWHISLTKFFTNYIYIPLGGSKNGLLKTCINTLIVFTISGLWHGANWTYILWGLANGMLLIFDRLFGEYEKQIANPLRWMITITIISVLWLLFRSNSISEWVIIIKQILSLNDRTISKELLKTFKSQETTILTDILPIGYFTSNIKSFWMLIYLLISTCVILAPKNNYETRNEMSLATCIASALLFVICFVCLGTESIFVYQGY